MRNFDKQMEMVLYHSDEGMFLLMHTLKTRIFG